MFEHNSDRRGKNSAFVFNQIQRNIMKYFKADQNILMLIFFRDIFTEIHPMRMQKCIQGLLLRHLFRNEITANN